MSETIEPTAETIELLTKDEVNQWINKLKSRGVPVELECGDCGSPTVVTVPPDEKDETQKTICRGCMTDHLREKGLL